MFENLARRGRIKIQKIQKIQMGERSLKTRVAFTFTHSLPSYFFHIMYIGTTYNLEQLQLWNNFVVNENEYITTQSIKCDTFSFLLPCS